MVTIAPGDIDWACSVAYLPQCFPASLKSDLDEEYPAISKVTTATHTKIIKYFDTFFIFIFSVGFTSSLGTQMATQDRRQRSFENYPRPFRV